MPNIDSLAADSASSDTAHAVVQMVAGPVEQAAALAVPVQTSSDEVLKALVRELLAQRENEVLITVVLTLLAAFAGVLGKVLYDRLNRRLRQAPESRLLLAELKEMHRHFKTNADKLEQLRAELEKSTAVVARPSPLHFEKLKAPIDGIFFDIEALRLLPPDRMRAALYARVKIRNRNAEAQRVVEYLHEGKIEIKTLKNYVHELIVQHDRLEDWLAEEILVMDNDWRPDRIGEEDMPKKVRKWRDELRSKAGMGARKPRKSAEPRATGIVINSPAVHSEPMPDPLYPKVEAIDLERLADMVHQRIEKKGK